MAEFKWLKIGGDLINVNTICSIELEEKESFTNGKVYIINFFDSNRVCFRRLMYTTQTARDLEYKSLEKFVGPQVLEVELPGEKKEDKPRKFFRTIKPDGTSRLVGLFRHKENGLYSFVNITSGTISPCTFDSVDAALQDLEKYKAEGKIKDYLIL